jgi:hypothetical protein
LEALWSLMMPTFRPVPLLAAFSFLAVSAVAAGAVAEEFRCQRGDLVRRIELRLADDADRLPCEVVYWQDSEAPGRPQSLWNAQHQLDYCRDKAREMVEGLRSAGWSCDATPTASESAVASPGRSAPAAENPTQSAPRPADPAVARPPRGAEPQVPTARPDQPTLRAALARDIQRLDELTADASGGFATEATALGDLNGDGLEDAAVLLTHRVDGAEPTHYLLAYLFDGETFQPVARLNLDAYYKNFAEVGIEDVAAGAVEVLLRVPRPDDPQCCPSGRRQATFGLRERQLIFLKETDPDA